MAYNQPERIVDSQKENERLESEERRNSLKLIKADLLRRIAAKWANKEKEPIVRDDFKLCVRPANMAVSSSDIFPFGSVEFCFEQDAEKMLYRMGRQFPGRNLIMEFLLFPYEHGGKNLRPEAVFKPLGVVVGKRVVAEISPVSAQITATAVQVEVQSHAEVLIPDKAPVTAQMPVLLAQADQSAPEGVDTVIDASSQQTAFAPDAVQAIMEVPPREMVPAQETSSGKETEFMQDISSSQEITKKRKRVRNRIDKAGVSLRADIPAIAKAGADAAGTGEAVPVADSLLLPSNNGMKSTLEQLKELIRGTAVISSEKEDSDIDTADKPIDYDFAKWRLYAKSQVLKRIKKALEANGINTPRELADKLGTDNPTKKEWQDFIRSLDVVIAPNWLGGSGSRDLLYWMRRNKLIQSDFRKE